MTTDAEQTMINALHEAWHCAAAFEKQQPVNRIHLWPYPGTGWVIRTTIQRMTSRER
jgi:hypothetical protein